MPGDYVFIDFNPEWPEFVVAVNELELRLRRAKRPIAADMLLRAYGRHRDEMHELAIRMAKFATEELRHQERDTRVRPPSIGVPANERLETNLIAEPIDANIMPGSVGVAKRSVLDADVPWWPTNEEGSSAQIGRIIFGTFYGTHDAGPPDPSQFREHPMFEPGKNGTLSGRGVIENPIPARRFIKKAVDVINARWHEGFTASKLRFNAELTRVLNTHR